MKVICDGNGLLPPPSVHATTPGSTELWRYDSTRSSYSINYIIIAVVRLVTYF